MEAEKGQKLCQNNNEKKRSLCVLTSTTESFSDSRIPWLSHGPWPEEATHLGVARSILHRYFFLTCSQARDVVLWIAIKRRLSVKCVIGLNIDIMRRNHPKRYTNGCCTMNLQFTAQNYKTTGIPFPFTWEFLSEDLSARQNPAEKRELGDRKCVSMNNRIAPLNYELRARKCPIKCDWLSTISELELNREPGVIHASQKKVIMRSDRPWPLRTSYTTKSLSLKTCPSPIPVTEKWAWKRLLPFWYPVFADASQMIGKIVRRGCFLSTKVQAGFFAVRRSFFHSVKASTKQKVRVF